MQRQFTSGSRQAPDPFDQFLEENDFYRKHTARDASCLFRVISEQMYDTQQHHLTIRKKCVRYMRKHRDYFQPLINRDLDEYLDDMSKMKTYGTLIELQAVGYVFQRNVILFEPFDLGKFYSNSPHFNEVFRVFYTPERHFDSVFTSDYIKDAAICQSICYEILYKDLFKLPDVGFAVEQMLHSSSFEGTECRTECNEDGYYTHLHMSDGRSFELDLPQNTCCILENYKLCHFHYTNFPLISDELQRELKVYGNHRFDSVQEKNAMNKAVASGGGGESLLPDKFISCVRQLLLEGITPFPYKVAKALDPNMYRNIEFDSWNEARKELKLQNWYNGDTNFKVGAKCHVKLRKSENDLYTCHIQEIAVDKGYCIVFIEQLGEKRLVPYESLTPLPPEQFKPWTLPYRLQRHMQKYSSFRYTRHYNYRFKCNGQFSAHEYCSSALPSIKSEYYDGDSDDEKHVFSSSHPSPQHHSSCYYKLKQYTHLENFRTQTVEYCAMPLTVEHGNRGGGEHEQKVVSRSGETSTRAPSRSSVVTVDGQQIKQEHDEATLNGGGVGGGSVTNVVNGVMPLMEQPYGMENGVFVPEMHFYPVHQYAAGGPEEFYGYGYDGSMHPTALMPANGGGAIYYTCAPSYAAQPGNNLYMHGGPPTQPPLISAALGSNAGAGSGAGGFFPGSYFGAPMMAQPPPALSTALAPTAGMTTPISVSNLTPTARGAGRGGGGGGGAGGGGASSGGSVGTSSITPLTGRINWDAKKSVKANGSDLPADMATLRYFYNLGLDYHSKQQARQQQRLGSSGMGEIESTTEVKEHIVKLSGDLQNMKLDENGNIQEINKSDMHNGHNTNNTNNNSNSMQNSNSANAKSYNQQRRFQSRYFNSKERQSYQQRQNSTAMNTGNMHNNRSNNSATSQHQSDANKNNINKTSNAGSSNLRNHMQSNNSNGPSANHNSGSTNSLHANSEQNLQTSPLQAGYDAGQAAGNGGETALTPTAAYNPNMNPFITYGAYEYAPDPNGVPPQFMAPPPGGVFIQMPMAAPAYGIYSGPPPPPPPPGALSMHPTTAVYPPYMGHPPPPLPPPATASAGAATISPMHGSAPTQPSSHATVPPTVQGPLQNGFYATGAAGGEAGVDGNGGIVTDGIGVHYQCMGYPPMPFYYATNTAAAGMGAETGSNPFRAGPAMNGGVVAAPVGSSTVPVNQQGYWCVPPTSMSATQTNSHTNGGVSHSGATSSHNRREQSATNE